MTTTRLLAFLVALCFAGSAQAQFSWGEVPSLCTPTPATAANLQTNVASVTFAAGATGQIILNCKVEPFSSGAPLWGMQMTYQDSTGANPAASVRVTLWHMPITGGTPAILVTNNSDSAGSTGTLTLGSPGFSHTFDFSSDVYWVRIILERAATTQVVRLDVMGMQGSFPSDIRLKHDIELLGHLENGLGLYRYSYNGSDTVYVGVMAQEVERIMPDAVVRGEDGYLRVFYGRLGLRLQTWDEWVAGGQKLP